MNYGKFFRLNLAESKIVDKVAVYDYTDLPAYFGESKLMSPKYPITLCITSDSLRFRLHYCAYHDGDDNFFYELNDKQGNIETIHMQEVILEIPYSNNSMLPISSILKQIYIDRFPFSNPAEDSKEESNPQTRDGNLFLANLLQKRYEGKTSENLSDVEKQLYEDLRVHSDSDPSFSTLWLMGLREDVGKGQCRIDLKDGKNGPYVGVLRKLLLDFMFDLKHSEVFQTSSSYQQMYSGLMSDFYFSALMHKCEYYYYRGLTLDAISKVESIDTLEKERQEQHLNSCINVKESRCIGCLDLFRSCFKWKEKLINSEKEKSHPRIQELYATNLFDAEKSWVEDIMNPLAERLFQSEDDDFKLIVKKGWWERRKDWIKKNIGESLRNGRFITRDDWFADPEEELRRVCFTMKERKKTRGIPFEKKHSCNSETVAEYLGIQSREGISELRSRISRWFLKRNAFLDILHLHYFKYAHVLIPGLLFILSLLFVFDQSFFSQDAWRSSIYVAPIAFGLWGVCLIIAVFFWTRKSHKPHKYPDEEVLVGVKTKLVGKRMFWWMLITGVEMLLLFAAINANKCISECYRMVYPSLITAGLLLIGAIILFRRTHLSLLRNVHLLFPRLVASIAAAWLTLAIGNELFQSFFDTIPSWISCALLSLIVLIFLMYEMNRIVPRESTFVKFIRSAELLVISYVLSVVVGLFIINFTGERFMERSGYLETFYNEYVGDGKKFSKNTNNTYRQDYYYRGKDVHEGITTNDEYLNNLQNLTVVRQGENTLHKKPVATYWIIGNYRFFILRDFLVQFAFLAMFIGVFIQMIFEEKSITEM